MTTLVGTQQSFDKALYDLCELDFDAAEAYEAAIKRLDNLAYVNKLRQFKEDHLKHIYNLRNILQTKLGKAPNTPSVKQWLTKGKVIIAELAGDRMILSAMLSNEEDTNTAYKKMYDREDKWPEVEEILRKGLSDEIYHKSWLEQTLKEDF